MGIVIFFLVVCVATGLAVLLWDRGALGEPARLDQYERFLDRDPDRFRHLPRIMAPEDVEFLRSFPHGQALAARLARDRRRVFRLMLLDLRQEFRAMLAVGVMLAASPTARNESFGLHLMMQAWLFRLVFSTLYVGSYLPFALAWIKPHGLMAKVYAVRESTRELLAAMNQDDMNHLRNQILG